jgi:hypothetical protein
VAWGDRLLFLVVHMVKSWVEWLEGPSVSGGVFTASGRLLVEGSSLRSVLVYYDDPRAHRGSRLNEELGVRECLERSYSIGELAAGVVPEPYYYEGVETIRPLEWVVEGGEFRVSFELRPVRGPGLYTVVLVASNTLGVKHPYDPSRFSEGIPVLYYSVLLGGG